MALLNTFAVLLLDQQDVQVGRGNSVKRLSGSERIMNCFSPGKSYRSPFERVSLTWSCACCTRCALESTLAWIQGPFQSVSDVSGQRWPGIKQDNDRCRLMALLLKIWGTADLQTPLSVCMVAAQVQNRIKAEPMVKVGFAEGVMLWFLMTLMVVANFAWFVDFLRPHILRQVFSLLSWSMFKSDSERCDIATVEHILPGILSAAA